MIDAVQLVTGTVLAFGISLAARKVHALNRSGMWASAGLGTVIMGLGGFGWAVVLMGFFISSSLLSRLFKRQKSELNEKYAKGSERDAWQVLANGGIAGVSVLLGTIWLQVSPALAASSPNASGILSETVTGLTWLAFAGALAAANADTWATELGALSPAAPRLITNFKVVERGASGGISLTGTLAALAGSTFIAVLAILFWPGGQTPPGLPGLASSFALITAAGLAGSLVDSLLGASLQAIYFCPICRKETERHPLHSCGTLTQRLRGLPWLNNDWVNTLCTLSGALLAWGLSLL